MGNFRVPGRMRGVPTKREEEAAEQAPPDIAPDWPDSPIDRILDILNEGAFEPFPEDVPPPTQETE